MIKKCYRCKQEFEITEQEKKFCSEECRKEYSTYHKKYNRKYNKSHKKELKEKRDEKNNNPEYKALRKRLKLMERYNLTEEEFFRMIVQQNNKCAICQSQFINSKNTHVDHNHNTGKVRALLCRTCNAGLGQFKENIEILQKAINYLNRENQKCQDTNHLN